MTDHYLPELLTTDEACAYLAQRTSSPWTLPRLLAACPVPWVWLEYSPGWPAIFGNRLEGFAAPMIFAGDVQRLRAQPDDALLTTSRTPEGELFRVDPGIRFPLSELRFRRDDVMAQASSDDASPEVHPECTSPVTGADDWRAVARAHADELDARDRAAQCHDSRSSIADRVATIMGAAGEHGPRGPLKGSAILREALSGTYWKRKR